MQLEALRCVMLVPSDTACAGWAESGLDVTYLFPAGLLSAHSPFTYKQCID